MDFKIIDKSFGEYTNSIIIEGKIDGVKTIYDIRVKFDKMKIYVDSYGIKTGRQREFRYPKLDNMEYRKASIEERGLLTREFYKENIPSEVSNLALEEFSKSIIIDTFQ